MHTFRKKLCLSLTALALISFTAIVPLASAQSAKSGYTTSLNGLPYTELAKPTNTLAGAGGLRNTNVLFEITNGTTTVTSAPVALRGFGVRLWLTVSPTNALNTNFVSSFRLSRDGTNWGQAFLWNSTSIAGATGKWIDSTNLQESFIGNAKYIQWYQAFWTNGLNTAGSCFSTNEPPITFQTFL